MLFTRHVRVLIVGLVICIATLLVVMHTRNEPFLQPENVIAKEERSLINVKNVIRDQTVQNIDERLIRPLKGYNFSPIIKQFLDEQGKNSAGPRLKALAYSSVKPRATSLTSQEQEQVDRCVRTAAGDRAKDYSKFFSGKTQEMRRTHHSYLNEHSLMLEVGGNWGWDAGNFSKLYNPKSIILEPLQDYVNILEKKFENKTNVNIYNLGLGAGNETVMVKLEGNNACATSKFSGKGGNVPLYIIEATSFMTHLGVGAFDVDLLTMNCEGCEYEALENLLSSSIIERFRNVQWATHSLIKGLKDPVGRYCRIHALLSRTHKATYMYKFNWESWRRKDVL